MRKKPSERLETVLKLAKIKEQAAAVKLADNLRNVESHRQQEKQLQQYKDDYHQQFSQQGGEVKSAADLLNFQRFYNSLEEAELTQKQRTVLAKDQCELAQAEWQLQYGKEKNMQSLVERKQQKEMLDEEKKDQARLDDRVTSNFTITSMT